MAKKEAVKKTSVKPKAAKAPKAEAPAKVVKEKAAKAEKVAKPVVEKPPKPPKPPKPEKKSKATLAAEKALSEENKKWVDLKEKHGNDKAQTYTMSGSFEPGKPLLHKVLGWGFVTNIQNDRLEVLFETGSKILISNYKTA